MANYCPSNESVDLFNAASKKNRDELSPEELRAIIACFGWLDNDERAKFGIKRVELTDDEVGNYTSLHLIDLYFPE